MFDDLSGCFWEMLMSCRPVIADLTALVGLQCYYYRGRPSINGYTPAQYDGTSTLGFIVHQGVVLICSILFVRRYNALLALHNKENSNIHRLTKALCTVPNTPASELTWRKNQSSLEVHDCVRARCSWWTALSQCSPITDPKFIV